MRRLQHLLTEATSQKSNLYPSQGEKECAACLLMIKLYLKDTCSDCWLAHTCLCAVTITNVSRHLCEEVTSFDVGWISWLVDLRSLLSLARGSFWYKCPFVPLIVRIFHPTPPHLHLMHISLHLHVLIRYLHITNRYLMSEGTTFDSSD